uniref:t-SNARE coiled-coil homology domain-containing protein n=1 Tax=Heterorhabditis bacteriophora TaxID=37862 RepID=A0A1I7XLI3_HETBA
MPTDQTPYFKARAKTIKQRLGQSRTKEGPLAPSLGYKKLALAATNTGKDVAGLSQLVLSHRRDYLAFNAPTGMSDGDRDQFDRDCEKNADKTGGGFYELSVGYLSRYRCKYNVTMMKEISFQSGEGKGSLLMGNFSYTRKSGQIIGSGWDDIADLNSAIVDEVCDVHLSSQEKTQMIAENKKIFEKFIHVNSEIEGLEAQIVEIQKLQETFAEKIMDQERDIDVISEAAIQTTENLRDGNEWIRQAISNSAGRRVVVLFCIIVITFTLLFLDWYNI